MKKTDMKAYKEKLILLRARLRGDLSQMADAALSGKNSMDGGSSGMPIHMADIGSDNYEQEFTLSLIDTEGDTLGAIENALEKIEDGTYGKCDECEGVIPKTRLNAIPYAPYCIKCAEKLER
ncbi:MAG: TraR/DksA family transcriptional regulator [Pirellulales bacterium]|nr:TraR/DksA family transcriptional regulator [Pirellulales bacterium]